jgi:c-di-GMP-binding flagellar brake protein YcgR
MIEDVGANNTESKNSSIGDFAIEVNETIQAKMPGDVSSYFSRVNDIQESRIVIAWPTNRGIRMALHPNQNIELAFVREGNAYTFTAYILEATPDPFPQVTVLPDSPIRKVQRRQHFRVKCLMPVQITGSIQEKSDKSADLQSSALYIKTVTYDLSAGGLSIRHPTQIAEETVIEAKLGLPDGGPEIKVPGRIAYSGSLPGDSALFHTGVDFLAISDWEQARIIRCLYRIQLKSLRD